MQNMNLQNVTEVQVDMDKRSAEEIYLSIISKLKVISETNGKELTEQEIDTAARNLIEFCQEVIKYEIKTKAKITELSR